MKMKVMHGTECFIFQAIFNIEVGSEIFNRVNQMIFTAVEVGKKVEGVKVFKHPDSYYSRKLRVKAKFYPYTYLFDDEEGQPREGENFYFLLDMQCDYMFRSCREHTVPSNCVYTISAIAEGKTKGTLTITTTDEPKPIDYAAIEKAQDYFQILNPMF